MLRLTVMIFVLLLWGCHHYTQPQAQDDIEHHKAKTESLMADFAHRY